MQTKVELPMGTLLMMISFAVVNGVIVTPALPDIALFFLTSTGVTEQIMSFYLIGYAFGQLIYGPLANRFGRKPALYLGVVLQVISSLFCILSGILHIFSLLILGRFILALGASVGLKMAFTLLNECYEPKIVSQKVSYLMLAFAVTPGLSVALGGFLNTHYGWMSCFYAGAIYGLLLLTQIVRLPETLTNVDIYALKIKHLLFMYGKELKNHQLLAGGVMMGLTTCFIYVFSTVAPFIAINLMAMSSQTYGIASLIPSVGYIVGAISSANLAKNLPPKIIIRIGICIIVAGVIWLSLAILLGTKALFSLFIPVSIIYLGESLIYPNASVIAMRFVNDISHASAIMNFLTIGLPVLAVLFLSLLPVGFILLPIVFSALCLLIITVYISLDIKQTRSI